MNQNSVQNMEVLDEGISFKELIGIIGKYRYLIGLIVFITLLLAVLYLFVADPVYEASGQLLIESQRSSLLMGESLGLPGGSSTIQLNTAIERIKGRSTTDSVAVKTNSFMLMDDEAEEVIESYTCTPPDSIQIFRIVSSHNTHDEADYQVFTDTGDLLAKGYFGKKLTLENISLVLNSSASGKEFKITLLPSESPGKECWIISRFLTSETPT